MQVTIGGSEPEALFDVRNKDHLRELGDATIVVGDTAANRTIESGDKVVIDRPGSPTWRGYVSGKPTRQGKGEISVEAKDARYELQQLDLTQLFYDMDSGDAVKRAVLQEAEGRGEQNVHRGETLAGWTSDLPVFELANLPEVTINERGSDLIFGGLRKGASGSYRMTYTDVPAAAIPGSGQVLRLDTRVLVNDPGNQIAGEIELRDTSGTQFVWKVGHKGTGFNDYTLDAAEATSDGELAQDGALQYRFDVSGSLSDNSGIVVDWASTYPFTLKARDTDLTANSVQQTGRDVTRRANASILEFIDDMQTEDGYSSWVDTENDLHYEPAGGSVADKVVEYGVTAVTEASFDTNYDQITNRVTVRGNPDEDIQVTIEDSASIQYYGVSPRSKPIYDPEIQTQDAAEKRGRGFLDDNAWNDTTMTFELGDPAFRELQKGDALPIDWPPRNISGSFVVDEVEVDRAGLVTVKLGGSTARGGKTS